jgi:hypothetical protein
MHDVIVEELERHLSGNASRAFYDHLGICHECRAEVAQMDDVSTLLRELKPASLNPVEPSLGFYNRVSYRIVEHQQKEAWGIFSPGAAFFRRIACASLLLLAGLGSFLVTRESSFGGTDAATIMAQHDPVAAHSESSDRDRMLVTLATYRE